MYVTTYFRMSSKNKISIYHFKTRSCHMKKYIFFSLGTHSVNLSTGYER